MKRYKRGAEERVRPHKEQPVFHVQKPQVLAIATLLPVRSTTCNTGRPSLFVINKRGSMTKGKESCSVICLYLWNKIQRWCRALSGTPLAVMPNPGVLLENSVSQ